MAKMGQKRSCCKSTCLIAFGIVLLIGLAAAIALGVLYAVHEYRTEMSATDVKPVPKLSSLWCSWQQVNSARPITVYKVTNIPIIKPYIARRYNLNFDLNLHWGQHRLLKYYLLKGSVVNIQACARDPAAFLYVFKGRNALKDCAFKYIREWEEIEDSHEHDDSREDDRRESSESIRESVRELRKGIRDNVHDLRKSIRDHVGDNLERRRKWLEMFLTKKCSSALRFIEIPEFLNSTVNDKCPFSIAVKAQININESDTYYFAIENFFQGARNPIKLNLNLAKTEYSLTSKNEVCIQSLQCDVPLSFASNHRALVSINNEMNAGQISYDVVSYCKPRVLFILFVFIVIPLTFVFILGCCISLCRRSDRTYKLLVVKDEDNEGRAPLLGPNNRRPDYAPTAPAGYQNPPCNEKRPETQVPPNLWQPPQPQMYAPAPHNPPTYYGTDGSTAYPSK